MSTPHLPKEFNGSEIAIIGMSGRLPGAKDIKAFWQNLQDGVESVSFFRDEELLSSGVDPTLLNNSNYVKANAVLADVDLFDAEFFGFSPKEAEIIDPQHRLFLEYAWEAIENAGYDCETYEGSIGVYAGAEINAYLLNNIYPKFGLSDLQTLLGNDKDYLSSRVSYKLNLKGPSVTIQTACSTSLVAVHMACQSLLNGECDISLAGGVAVRLPEKAGYVYQEDMIYSPDGHCRAFDARAQGTVFGSGVGIVVLKRLTDAIADGDYIHAIIKGSAINNDGSLKVGYTAPSRDGQAAAIAEAQVIAGIDPETVSYIEAHGTGTPLGDPIELAALTQVFRASTQKKGFCAIGSVKTNFGHLGAAAGVAGLMKTVLALKHQMIPPSLHFEQPNPKIDFANSPFYVNSKLSEWKTDGTPRYAGVSSFGIGGTNAHVVLEEYCSVDLTPPTPLPYKGRGEPDSPLLAGEGLGERLEAPLQQPSEKSRPWQLLVLSAKTSSALETATANLAEHLKQHPDLNLADIAYTLQVGRRTFDHRRMVVCQDLNDAVKALESPEAQRAFTHYQQPSHRSIVFMFSGQGAQYANMARELYEVEPTFRQQVDICSDILKPLLGLDLRQVLYPSEEQVQEAASQLKQTAIAQPALFVIEYALAKLWMKWGVTPVAMIGHSIGEYVAATIAGVFSLEDALALVTARGQLMQKLPSGTMLAVPLPEKEVQPLLGKTLSLAAINGLSSCVVSGPTEAVEALQNQLASQGVECRLLHTSHAFHSQMMEPILEPFTQRVKQVNLKPPQIPYLSNVTATWITAEQATDSTYWGQHLRQTVRFAEGLQELLKEPAQILLEVGPGKTLSTLARRHPDKQAEQVVLSSVRHPQESGSDVAFLLNALGQLWLAGVKVDWSGFYSHEQRYRLPLPTYPFERQRYWIEPPKPGQDDRSTPVSLGKKPDIADWFYLPFWKPSVPPMRSLEGEFAAQTSCTLVFSDECGLAPQLVKQLQVQSQDVITVKVGSEFAKLSDRLYTLNPGQPNDYHALFNELRALDKLPNKIVHFWSVTPLPHTESGFEGVEKAQEIGFYSLLFLAQALGKHHLTDEFQITVVSNNMQSVTGVEVLCPEKATVLGPIKVIPQEYPNITCRSIDVVTPASGSWQEEKLIDQLLTEITTQSDDLVIAYRGNQRWVQTFEPVRLEDAKEGTARLRQGGVYLITGGLGGIGLILAEHLAKTVQAKLILTGRSAFPARDEWEKWLATHDEQDSVSRKIRKVQQLEELGAEVMVVSADVANLEQMQDAIAKAQRQFGQLNSVIHAAGILTEKLFSTIDKTEKTDCQQQFNPKIHGLLVLEQLLHDTELDFCVLLSSLSSVLGGLGLVSYSSANIFMDAFVHQHNLKNKVPWISINLDSWQVGEETKNNNSWGSFLAEFSINLDEGIEVFKRLLSWSEIHQVVVSTGELQSRINQWIKPKSLQESAASKKVNSSSVYSRPNLRNAYVAPRNEVEQKLAEIWQELLGIESVGIHDNFFELGGDSIVSTQIVFKAKQIGLQLMPKQLFEHQTIADLATVAGTLPTIESEQELETGQPPLTNRLTESAQSSKEGYTPSDFPKAQLNQKDLDKFLAKINRRN
jgi:acyl transferase domain-containing protein